MGEACEGGRGRARGALTTAEPTELTELQKRLNLVAMERDIPKKSGSSDMTVGQQQRAGGRTAAWAVQVRTAGLHARLLNGDVEPNRCTNQESSRDAAWRRVRRDGGRPHRRLSA